MSQPTAGAASSAASVLFNLPDHEVLEATRDDDGARTVVIAATASEAACPDCGALSSRVHQRTRQRLADVSFDGHVEVAWIKKRCKCTEALCARKSFTEHTDQVPPRARLTTGLKDAILDAVASEVRAIDRVANQFGLSWPTVQRLVDQAAAALAAWRRTRPRLVRRLGIDEHRFRSVR
ncbi:transposase family protein [Nocardioides acrostichi]|uniref:Transposase family protein n=1 Tax=Nocardioides acrostichi TaxID=2784339 RepID=A0A930V1E3_9ACTN|nr:transposase family protein [Nocardioides acrostichi]MBF4161449.1 transposase family protein [Nocardioides acrostichi]